MPGVIKTNIDLPSIVGGKQSVYFFPDVILITEGNHAGAISYEELGICWNSTVFVEDDGVPPDAQVVGHTWQYVNKAGGPDRRFNNNRQIPQVLYQQMGLQGPGGFQKILHISRVADRSEFDTALAGLRGLIKVLERLALEPPPRSGDTLDALRGHDVAPPVIQGRRSRSVLGSLATLCAVVGIAGGVAVLFIGLYAHHPNLLGQPGPVAPAAPVASPSSTTASAGAATNNSVAGSAGARSSAIAGQDAYTRGITDWRALKAWSDSQTGDRRAGADYWAANRSVPGHTSCADKADAYDPEKNGTGPGHKAAFAAGCQEAKRRLDPIDDRRRKEPQYRAGFADEAKRSPLNANAAPPPGTIVPPPPRP